MTWKVLKQADGFIIKPNTYIINEYGEVRRCSDKSIVKPRVGNVGHLSVQLEILTNEIKYKRNNNRRDFGVHRLVANVFKRFNTTGDM